jgi:hypothetical protein
MYCKTTFAALAVVFALLLSSSQAGAWGVAHVGYTHVGYGGVQHYGRTAAVGPYGAYSGAHYGAYGAGGAYRVGGAYGVGYGGYGYPAGVYNYGGVNAYGGYGYGGFGATNVYGGYAGGVYRRY